MLAPDPFPRLVIVSLGEHAKIVFLECFLISLLLFSLADVDVLYRISSRQILSQEGNESSALGLDKLLNRIIPSSLGFGYVSVSRGVSRELADIQLEQSCLWPFRIPGQIDLIASLRSLTDKP